MIVDRDLTGLGSGVLPPAAAAAVSLTGDPSAGRCAVEIPFQFPKCSRVDRRAAPLPLRLFGSCAIIVFVSVFATLGFFSINPHAKKMGDTGDAVATEVEMTSKENTSPGSLCTTRRQSGATLETPTPLVTLTVTSMNCGTGMATICSTMSSTLCSVSCGTGMATTCCNPICF